MADISFSCPSCDQHIVGDAGLSRMSVVCPTCKATFTVPVAETEAVPSLAPQPEKSKHPSRPSWLFRKLSPFRSGRFITTAAVVCIFALPLSVVGYFRQKQLSLVSETCTLSPLRGKKLLNAEIQTWLDKSGAFPKISRYDDCCFYELKQQGIVLRFDTADKLTDILFTLDSTGFTDNTEETYPFGCLFDCLAKRS